jgi:hypothetical protein
LTRPSRHDLWVSLEKQDERGASNRIIDSGVHGSRMLFSNHPWCEAALQFSAFPRSMLEAWNQWPRQVHPGMACNRNESVLRTEE